MKHVDTHTLTQQMSEHSARHQPLHRASPQALTCDGVARTRQHETHTSVCVQTVMRFVHASAERALSHLRVCVTSLCMMTCNSMTPQLHHCPVPQCRPTARCVTRLYSQTTDSLCWKNQPPRIMRLPPHLLRPSCYNQLARRREATSLLVRPTRARLTSWRTSAL